MEGQVLAGGVRFLRH
uniref:Uncharacterized protein n=1 Tax=Timema bartmani TaxID=61472 RepID=A0A7R9FFC0_9NEOP|nr:unnamed protein product [Timema bartmani]